MRGNENPREKKMNTRKGRSKSKRGSCQGKEGGVHLCHKREKIGQRGGVREGVAADHGIQTPFAVEVHEQVYDETRIWGKVGMASGTVQ